MNKYDKGYMFIVIIMAISVYVAFFFFIDNTNQNNKQAIVEYKGKEVLRIDLTIDGQYVVSGTLGDVVIEVQDQQIRVTKETSNYHLCSYQGFVSNNAIPIICLPNDIVITIVSNESNVDTVIS
ncbi:MAG: NusG domain II-containing protein [Erysipelotrichaceae bacterium]